MKILLFSLYCLCAVSAFTQTQSATTQDGRKVILKSDGSWIYDEPKKAAATPVSDCSKYISSTLDKVSGKTNTGGSKFIIVSNDGGRTGFSLLTVLSGSGVIALVVRVVDRSAGGCMGDSSKVSILFKDGTRLELEGQNKFNCDGEVTLYFGGLFGQSDALKILKTKPIETMRVHTFKSLVDRDFTPEQADQLMHQLSCLDSFER